MRRFSVVGGVAARTDGELDVASGDLVDVDKVLTAAGEVLGVVARPEAILSVDGLSVLGESVGAPCKVRVWSATCTGVGWDMRETDSILHHTQDLRRRTERPTPRRGRFGWSTRRG
jgi:hypothetical protein